MADIRFSTLINGSTVAFNPSTDRIIFEQEAVDVDFAYQTETSLTIHVFGKDVTFTGSLKDIVGGPMGNFITANGSVWIVGDNDLSISDPAPATTDDGPNIIRGGSQGDFLMGLGGNDTIYGGAGRDAIRGGTGNNYLNGGDGDDSAQYSGSALFVDLARNIVSRPNGEVDQIYGIEQIWTQASYSRVNGAYDDTMLGDDANNYFSTYAGNDLLEGRGGDDTFRAGIGRDTIHGGDGFDELAYHDNGALEGITIDLGSGSGTIMDPWGDLDTFTSIEAARGTKFDDTITGSDDANRFRGFAGDDVIDGRGGHDWIDYSLEANNHSNQTGRDGGVTVNLQTGLATDPFGNTDRLISIEGATGTGDADTIIGGHDTNFRLEGLGGNDVIMGLAGADTINGGTGNDWLDGGDGRDTAIFSGERSSYAVSTSAANTVVAGGDGTDTLAGIERLQFSDGTLAFDITGKDGNAGTIYRLYQAAFDRKPDAPGLGYWIKEFDQGQKDLAGVAYDFLISDEFEATYGSPETVSDEAFLNLLYRNVLGRDADGPGKAYWLEQMANGFARERVLASFSESEENQKLVAADIKDGIWFI